MSSSSSSSSWPPRASRSHEAHTLGPSSWNSSRNTLDFPLYIESKSPHKKPSLSRPERMQQYMFGFCLHISGTIGTGSVFLRSFSLFLSNGSPLAHSRTGRILHCRVRGRNAAPQPPKFNKKNILLFISKEIYTAIFLVRQSCGFKGIFAWIRISGSKQFYSDPDPATYKKNLPKAKWQTKL